MAIFKTRTTLKMYTYITTAIDRNEMKFSYHVPGIVFELFVKFFNFISAKKMHMGEGNVPGLPADIFWM